MWDIKYLLKDFLRERNFQQFINNRFEPDPIRSLIDRRIVSKTMMYDGNMFFTSPDYESIAQAYTEYDTHNIHPDTTVLDIGANIGGFALRAARKAKHVYAVEPVMEEYLSRNIALNDLSNITTFDAGIGAAGNRDVTWHGRTKSVRMHTFSEIIKMCGTDVDFLKMDCEGCEHAIVPEDIAGIQYIEAELHNFTRTHPFAIFCDMLKSCGFEYTVDLHHDGVTAVVHAINPVARKRFVVG